MKKKQDAFEKELNEIRVEIYKETKHMTPKEYVEYIKRQTAPMIEEYGWKTVSMKEERKNSVECKV